MHSYPTVESGYQLHICVRDEGKHLNSMVLLSAGWTFPLAFRLLAISPAFQYAKLNISPCSFTCSCLTLKLYTFLPRRSVSLTNVEVTCKRWLNISCMKTKFFEKGIPQIRYFLASVLIMVVIQDLSSVHRGKDLLIHTGYYSLSDRNIRFI